MIKNLQLAKGVRDFPAEEKILRNKVLEVLTSTFESYGFNPFETPIIERLETLKAKFAAGEESDALKEIFTLKDQGNRELGMRFELTLSLCRYIAMNPNIKMPFKRYEIGRVYRDGPIKLGRYREFWQCDVDIVGTNSLIAEAEILGIVVDVFKKLGLDIRIQISNRKLLNGLLKSVGVPDNLIKSAMISIDKLHKIGIEGVNKELYARNISKESVEKLSKILSIKGSNENRLNQLKEHMKTDLGNEGLKEMEILLGYTKAQGININFDQTLARGLSYYTGPIFEAFLNDSPIESSVVGGGRYDEYIGNFLGKTKQVPATGLSFGLEPIIEALKLKKKKEKKSVTELYIISMGVQEKAIEIARKIRKNGFKVEMSLIEKGISNNLNYCNAYNIPFVLILGPKEIEEGLVTLKNMVSGKEEKITVDQVSQKLKTLIKCYFY